MKLASAWSVYKRGSRAKLNFLSLRGMAFSGNMLKYFCR